MTMYGSMMLNDLGSYQQCRQMQMADYAIITANMSRVPITIYFGACLPHECDVADFEAVGNAFSNLLTDIYKPFAPKEDGQGVFHPWTTLQISVRKTDQMMAEWKDKTRAGFILFIALAVPLILLISCIPTLYHIFTKMKTNYQAGAVQTQSGITEGPKEAADDQFYERSPVTNSLGNEPLQQQRNMMLNINQT
jgi:hypothetical protein